ncbi:RiPP maturation radical SAM C-methyltransferase [Ruminiclostridium cellulolyticum]|uniref:Radical SAM domain protein n=1 Tax=Ruminiclostridium cellulolyticum (strain ATCC 35319 / DSM 5812 / JCM 6584 / H10) TaxID=394503 RepID=B8I970_RUMCH|nr:RiPP maturation radical SAM C-methyltransferase [Ruminiclostridium cellulolyticum]ACL75330.1 Radical SAM domain protein [Ruminiclostridium cellulolyticum H10]
MKETALVYMPWATTTMPSLALGLLKSVLEREDIPTDVYYLNVRFTKYMDKVMYEEISEICDAFTFAVEWMFAQYLFSEEKMREGKVSYSNLILPILKSDPILYMYLRTRKEIIEPLINNIIPKFIEDCLNDIEWGNYKVVGFKCMIGYQVSSLLLSKKIKERYPDIKIVFGGPNVREVMGEEILKCFEWVDYVIDGEGEESLPALVKNIAKDILYEDIPGIVYMKDGECIRSKQSAKMAELDELPIPDYSDYYIEFQNNDLKEFLPSINSIFEGSRGCWWGEKCQCTFCGQCNGYLKFRSKSTDRVLNEVLDLIEKYDNKNFWATDCILSLDYFDTLIPELIKRKLDLNVFFEVKPTLTREQISMLYAAGIRKLQAGIENINTRLLKLMHKGVSAIQNIQFLKLCTEQGISVFWIMLYRIPGEEKQCYDEVINLIPSISHLEPPAPGRLFPINLDRFSPYFNDPEKYGIKDIKPKAMFNLIYPDPKINLNNISYEFDFTFNKSEETVKLYINNLNTAVTKWQKAYENKKYYCWYRVENDAVEIEDNRPIVAGQESDIHRKYTLKGLEMQVFLLCNDICSLEDIYREVNKNREKEIGKDKLQEIIGWLKDNKLLLEETGRYTNMALLKISK